jgi:hypothetical protein
MKRLYKSLQDLQRNIYNYKLIDTLETNVCLIIEDGLGENYEFARFVSSTLSAISGNLQWSQYIHTAKLLEYENSEYYYKQAKNNLNKLIELVYSRLQKAEI